MGEEKADLSREAKLICTTKIWERKRVPCRMRDGTRASGGWW